MNKIVKVLLSKLAWIIVAFVVFYFTLSAFNLVPQPMQDMVAWLASNFTTITILICFMVAAYLVNKILNRHKGKDQE
jgi:uncharacterized membrane protein